MRQEPVRESAECGCKYQSTLRDIQEHGPQNDKQYASAALIMWAERHPRSAGGQLHAHVNWGDRYPCIDYAAQELTIGTLAFLCIDMGFEIPSSTHLRSALGAPGKIERNQCVCVQLALGLEWHAQGRPKRIPNKTRIMALAVQLRCGEYQQAPSFAGKHGYPKTKGTSQLYSAARDIMSDRHDRNFQDVHVFHTSTSECPIKQAIRIFDLEQADGNTRELAYQFGPTDTTWNLDMRINLVVWRGHMGFLYPSAHTRLKAWRDWAEQVSQIVSHEWSSRSEWLEKDQSHPQFTDLQPCRICSRPCRLNANGKDGTAGTALPIPSMEAILPWWQKTNPRSGLPGDKDPNGRTRPTRHHLWRHGNQALEGAQNLFGEMYGGFDMGKWAHSQPKVATWFAQRAIFTVQSAKYKNRFFGLCKQSSTSFWIIRNCSHR